MCLADGSVLRHWLNYAPHHRHLKSKFRIVRDSVEARLRDTRATRTGDPIPGKYGKQAPMSVQARIRNVVSNQLRTTAAPTRTEQDAYRIAGEAFGPLLGELRTLVQEDLARLESTLESLGAPHTRGRFPSWEIE